MKIHPIIANNPLQNIFYVLEYGEKQALVIDPPEAKITRDFLDEHPFNVNHTFQDGDIVFEQDGISTKAIATPGHADGHMIFEVSEWWKITTIFSWDALFQWWIGHTRRWGTEILYESLQKFRKYEDEVMIYSGHDYLETNIKFLKMNTPENISEIDIAWKKHSDILSFTTLWEERKYNPFLTVSREEFIRLRELRNNF